MTKPHLEKLESDPVSVEPEIKKKKKKKFITHKRDVREIKVIDNKLLNADDIDRQLSDEEKGKKKLNVEEKQRRSGVIYFSSIPPKFNPSRIREQLSGFGDVGRIHLVKNKRYDKDIKFTEGWVEFASKRKAKMVAKMLSGTPIGGKGRRATHDAIWCCKYLHGFKWVHLMEQLQYEQKVEEQRLRAELSKVKRQAAFFTEAVEKGEKIKKLEEKVLKKGGLWEKYRRQVEQKKPIKKAEKDTEAGNEDLMKLIFDKED
ncbi:hypothetical protein FO519_006327 [Halicephalobus sp. NKZ332]|nr:hypothetical protein FO519_006327 [Halicephalobus sp. NKZ332]